MSRTPPPASPLLIAIAIVWVIIGGFGACGSAILLVPAWQAARGSGHTGTFTLTEPLSCDRNQPPRQRCGWFGDFVSDDSAVVRRHLELDGGLPPGAKIGDTVRARDAGSLAQIYQETDTQGWKTAAGFLAAFSGAFMLGTLVLEPWWWRARLRQRRARGSQRRGTR
jgi:hypothetical protein